MDQCDWFFLFCIFPLCCVRFFVNTHAVNRILFFLCLVVLAGCARLEPAMSPSASGDAEFARISDDFLAGHLAWRPQMGTALGLHEYDGKITDFSRASLDAERARLEKFDRVLARWSVKSLSPPAYHDLRLMQATVRGELFKFDAMHSYARNPMTYAGAFDVNIYIKRDFAPLEQLDADGRPRPLPGHNSGQISA